MKALDLRLPDRDFQCKSLAEAGVGSYRGTFSEDFMVSVGFNIFPSADEETEKKSAEDKISADLNQCINSLIARGTLSEVVGQRTFKKSSHLCYSTFVSLQPRPYFPAYCELLETIALSSGLRPVIWLEDLISLPRFDWSSAVAAHATSATKAWFEEKCEGCTTIVSSETEGGKIPAEFIEKYLSRLEFSDFLSMLPFHKRELSLITINDLAHCIWSAYVFSKFPGLHFTTTANKRNHIIYRKLCGKEYSVAFLHPIS